MTSVSHWKLSKPENNKLFTHENTVQCLIEAPQLAIHSKELLAKLIIV